MNYTGVDPKHELYRGRLSWALETCLLNHMNKQKFCQKQSNITPARDPKQRELCKALWGSLGLCRPLWGSLGLSAALWGSPQLSRTLYGFKKFQGMSKDHCNPLQRKHVNCSKRVSKSLHKAMLVHSVPSESSTAFNASPNPPRVYF